jgi:AcrR family transcriptional regulator
LPEALIEAALARLEREGVAALSLRELARDVGVNHRAVYRHFPDKLALLAHVAEEGYRRLATFTVKEIAEGMRGEDTLVAGGLGFFHFTRAHADLAQLMVGPRINERGAFPALERAIEAALAPFVRGFAEAGTPAESALLRAALYIAALQGITAQIQHRRLRVTREKAAGFVADICRMLIKGLR